jgi:general secretion pathway protein J
MKQGFTLLEVTVTMTILGLIVLIIFGVFRLGFSSWERGEALQEEYQKTRVLSQLITRQIKSAWPYKVKSRSAGEDYLAFDGKAASMKFVSTFPLKAKQAEGLVYAFYEFKEGGKEAGQLVFYEKRVLMKDFFEEELKEDEGTSLFDGISNIRFEYLREEDPQNNRSEEWVEEWNGKVEKALPIAVRMTFHYSANPQGSKKEKENEIVFSTVVSLPAYQFESVKSISPGMRSRMIQRAP